MSENVSLRSSLFRNLKKTLRRVEACRDRKEGEKREMKSSEERRRRRTERDPYGKTGASTKCLFLFPKEKKR